LNAATLAAGRYRQAATFASERPMSTKLTEPAKRLSRRAAIASLAALPAALPAAATAGADPIFAMIERHRELSRHYDNAVSVSAKLEEGLEFDAAEEISNQRANALVQHAAMLIRSEPTTKAGATALIRYIASLGEWEVPADDGWRQVFLSTLANALDRMI
jgi:hypothetical protein